MIKACPIEESDQQWSKLVTNLCGKDTVLIFNLPFHCVPIYAAREYEDPTTGARRQKILTAKSARAIGMVGMVYGPCIDQFRNPTGTSFFIFIKKRC